MGFVIFCTVLGIGLNSIGMLGSLKGFSTTVWLCGMFPGLMLLGRVFKWSG